MTKSVFGDMINEKLSPMLMYNVMLRDNYIMRVTKDRVRTWAGGEYIFPFEGGQASNFQSGGGLVPKSKLETSTYVRGQIDSHKEIHGAVIFYEKDLKQQGDNLRTPQDKYLKNLLGRELSRARDRFEFLFGFQCLNGGALGNLTETSTQWTTARRTAGTMKVDRPDRFTIGQRVKVHGTKDTDNSGDVEAYVSKIDMNTKQLSLVTTHGGSTASDLTGTDLTPATDNVVGVYLPGDEEGGGFTSFRSQVLPSANGGTANLFGKKKVDYPFLQSIVKNGMSISTRAGFISTLYDLVTDLVMFGQPFSSADGFNASRDKGNKSIMMRHNQVIDCIMSLEWFGVAEKHFQSVRGDYFKQLGGKSKTSFYDSNGILVNGPDGTILRLIGVKGMGEGEVLVRGADTTRFATLNYVQNYTSPDGNKFFVVRDDDDGYSWICDYRIYGDFIVKRPAGCAALHSLPASKPTS